MPPAWPCPIGECEGATGEGEGVWLGWTEGQGERRARRGSGGNSERAPASSDGRLAGSLATLEPASGRGSGGHGGAADGTADELPFYQPGGLPKA